MTAQLNSPPPVPTPPQLPDLHPYLEHLATAREIYTQNKAELDKRQEAFDQENAALIQSVKEFKEAKEAAEKVTREVALIVFARTGVSKPIQGVEIKQWDAVKVDPMAARSWALVNCSALLVLDLNAYDKLLREVRGNQTLGAVFGPMPGTVEKEAKPSIDKDLGAYLPVNPAPLSIAEIG